MNIGRLYWYLQRYSALYFLGFVIYIEYLFLTDSFSFDYLDSNLHFKILLTLFHSSCKCSWVYRPMDSGHRLSNKKNIRISI
jgi:hypothetical protein